MKSWLTTLLLFILGILTAQTPLSLSDAVQRGLENNYQIRIANNNVELAKSNDDWALAGRYPTVNLSLSPGVSYRNNTNPASIVSSSSITSYNVTPGANLGWTIFNGHRVRFTKDQLEQQVNLSEGQLKLQVENSVQQITQAYYNALVQQERIDVLEQVLGLSRDRIEYQQVRREYGQAGTFDEIQAKDAYLNDSTNLLLQQVAYENAIRNLLLAMGEDDPGLQVSLTDQLNYEGKILDREALTQRLLAANRSLQNLLINRDLANLNTKLAETANQPTVNLNAGLSYAIDVQTGTQTFDFGGDQPPRDQDLPGIAARTLQGNVGFSVGYLLYDGGARKRRIQTAQLQEINAQLNYESNKQNLVMLLNNTLSTYDNQVSVLQVTDQLITNAQANLSVAEERFKGGIINSFDYRQVQLSYINATFQRLSALFNLKNTETEILRLTGQIVP
ncbi:MAG: TolC family protein [Bacteroidota bacterium]